MTVSIPTELSELSRADFDRWTTALGAQPTRSEEFREWLEGPVRRFFPFERLFCAHGELIAGEVSLSHSFSVGHTSESIVQMSSTFLVEKRSSLAWWLVHRRPVLVDPSCPASYVSAFELDEISAFGLRNSAAHGILNPKANSGSYFSFAGVGERLSQWHAQALTLLAPVLHDRFISLVAASSSPLDLSCLTTRQREIVRCVVAGEDDKTIARRLDIAEKTVRNQLSEVYRHLGITKRAKLITLIR